MLLSQVTARVAAEAEAEAGAGGFVDDSTLEPPSTCPSSAAGKGQEEEKEEGEVVAVALISEALLPKVSVCVCMPVSPAILHSLITPHPHGTYYIQVLQEWCEERPIDVQQALLTYVCVYMYAVVCCVYLSFSLSLYLLFSHYSLILLAFALLLSLSPSH